MNYRRGGHENPTHRLSSPSNMQTPSHPEMSPFHETYLAACVVFALLLFRRNDTRSHPRKPLFERSRVCFAASPVPVFGAFVCAITGGLTILLTASGRQWPRCSPTSRARRN